MGAATGARYQTGVPAWGTTAGWVPPPPSAGKARATMTVAAANRARKVDQSACEHGWWSGEGGGRGGKEDGRGKRRGGGGLRLGRLALGLAHARPELEHRFGVDLADPAFGHPEDVADLGQG